MANIAITSTNNLIKVSFGDYYPSAIETSQGSWRKDKLTSIKYDSVVEVDIRGEKVWLVSYDGAGGSFQIDSVNGVAPTDNNHLYTLLINLLD